MKKEMFEEIEKNLENSKIDFEDLNDLEEIVTPFCDGGGCDCTGGANC